MDFPLRKSTQFRTFLPLNPAHMARLSSHTRGFSNLWLAALVGSLFLAGCATTPDFSALEDDELYLRRGEEFVTDAAYLAFAYENNVDANDGDDYYDPTRSTDFGPGYMNSYGMPGYQPSYYNRYRPFGGGFGNGFGTQWGLASYMNPYAAGGLGIGYGMGVGGYDPFYNGWGNPYGMGYGSGFGYSNPYAWNNGWGNSWNNPYGYNNWNNGWGNGWNTNYGGWAGTGSNDSFTSLTGRTRTPIMSYTGNGSNYDGQGVLVRPKVEAQRPDEVPAAAPARTEEASPTYVSPRESRRARGWMQPDNSTRERSNSSRSWSAPSNNSNNSFNNSSRSRSNSFSAPSNSGGSRSGGSSSGSSRSSSSSRSSRGGGR